MTKVINKKSEPVKIWNLPKMKLGANGVETEIEQIQTDEDIKEQARRNELVQQAIKEGFETGKQQGILEGKAQAEASYKQEWQSRIESFDSLINYFNDPRSLIDDELEQEILNLIVALSQKIVGHELKTNPEILLKLISEAKTLLPIESKKVTINVSEVDLDFLKGHIDKALSNYELSTQEDLEQGEFKIKIDNSEIEATFKETIENLANQVFNHA